MFFMFPKSKMTLSKFKKHKKQLYKKTHGQPNGTNKEKGPFHISANLKGSLTILTKGLREQPSF